MERSREKSNIPRPSTFNISSQDGRRAGRRVDWEIKQEDFQRGARWLCSTPAAIRRRDGNLTEAVWCALVFSCTCAKCWKISTCWMTAKKIMESERAFFFFSSCFKSALVWMTCTCLQETISEMIGTALYLWTVLRCPFLHCAWSVPFTCRKHFDWSPPPPTFFFFPAAKGARNSARLLLLDRFPVSLSLLEFSSIT